MDTDKTQLCAGRQASPVALPWGRWSHPAQRSRPEVTTQTGAAYRALKPISPPGEVGRGQE